VVGRSTTSKTQASSVRGRVPSRRVGRPQREITDVEPPRRHRAVDVEEVDREHAGGLGVQELPPTGVGVADRRRWIRWRWRMRRIVEAPTRWPSLSSSPWILL
jgi:hypothetical protein